MRLAENTGCKKLPSAQSHRFVGLYLRNQGTCQKSGKKLVKTAILPPHVLTVWWTSAH